MKLRPLTLLIFFVLVGHVHQTMAQQPLNLDFEQISTEGPTRPWNWTPYSYAPGATVLVDGDMARSGQRSLRISRIDLEQSPYSHSMAMYMSPLAALDKQVRVRGWIKTDNLKGHALFTVQAWADFEVLQIDSTHTGTSPLTTEWTRYQAEIKVPPETETLVITADMQGTGRAWFDDFTLEIEGTSYNSLPIARKVSDHEIEQLASYASPLASVDPTPTGALPDLADLKAIDSLIGDARIVALGESSHGTSEIFRLKHRVLEYLIHEHGFRLFAIEDQQLEMEKVNAYIKGATSTIEEAMRGMFGVWSTAEVRNLIEWMRTYNAEHPNDPVEFVGIDMQNPTLPIDSLWSFTKRYDPDVYPTLFSLLKDYREAWGQNQYPQYLVSDSVHHRWANGAEAAWLLTAARHQEWLRRAASKADSVAIEWAQQNARVVAQAGRYIFNHQPDRDSTMALNLKWHLDRRGQDARVVLWAHDSHISKGSATTTDGNYFLSSMGYYLNQLYGERDYRTFGIMFYDGAYTATRSMWGGPRNLAIIDAFPAPEGSLEHTFHRVANHLEANQFVMDLHGVRSDVRGQVLKEKRPYRFVGYAAEDYGFSGSIEIVHQFDGLFFVNHTTGTRPLRVSPWPPEGSDDP